jgi:predicted O-linked N-acetylglucosamine transferase (SPINDLY family)
VGIAVFLGGIRSGEQLTDAIVNSMLSRDSLLKRGQDLHKSGNLKAAADIYQQVLSRNPRHDEALYLLGCLAHQAENSGVAVDLLRKAAEVKPDRAEYQNALAVALYTAGFEDEAELRFRQAVALDNRPDYQAGLVTVLRKKERVDEAIEVLEGGTGPTQLHAKNLVLLRQLLISKERNIEADAHLEKVIAALPRESTSRCDFADVLLSSRDAAGASKIYEDILKDDPKFARAWYSAGSAQEALSDFAKAVDSFTTAVELRPDWLEARHNLGRALYEIGQVGPAFGHFKWCGEQANEGARHSRAMMAVIVPGVPEASNQEMLDVRRSWIARDVPAGNTSSKPLSRKHGKPLRIGYVSSFFQRDNWMKPVWALINQHDREAVEVNLFSDAPKESIRHGYQRHESDNFFDTSKITNAEIADLIKRREIDVLIDLNGYSNMSRLPMYRLRPAPAIIGWFNMYATTGMDAFDYLIGDHSVIPEAEESFYSEKIVRVEGSYLTFDVAYPVPPVAEAPCLRTKNITFGCLGSQYKITNEVVEAWSQILNRVPHSTLLLKNRHLGSESTCNFLQCLFEKHGVAEKRLRFEGPDDHYHFLQAYDRVDLALDTFPYNGGTTTTEAIWQGVPVLTFCGDRWASRTSASILHAGGLEEFVAEDLGSFIDLAVKLGISVDIATKLDDFRKTIRGKLGKSVVCDTAGFARRMEAIYLDCASTV